MKTKSLSSIISTAIRSGAFVRIEKVEGNTGALRVVRQAILRHHGGQPSKAELTAALESAAPGWQATDLFDY